MNDRADTNALSKLEPAAIWGFFSRIAAVPRPSKKEERIRETVVAMAKEHGLACREEAIGNVIIEVPASPGCESAPVTVLQAHLDMVCEKNAETDHDFDREGIRTIVDRDADSGETIVRAGDTTLGADNGIGVAMALAAATSPDVTHGPLELLFTIDEESGMSGAKALTPKSIRGHRLLNLDSEEDDALYIGCAGGCDSTLTFEPKLEPLEPGHAITRVKVSGLRGGHSGSDIQENRGNALKLLVRTLLRTHEESFRLVSIHGGQLRNAIPREAEAVVVAPTAVAAALARAAKDVASEAAKACAEPNVSIGVEELSLDEGLRAISIEDSWRILAALAALPHGVLGMDPNIPGLVETSNNVATINCTPIDGGRRMRVDIGNLARSSSEARKAATLAQIAAIAKLAGAAVETASDYPGWMPNPESPILSTCRRVYRDLFGDEPNVAAIHAGLECGIIGERVGDMDMVSLGPRIEGAHTPDERVYVASVEKSWKFLRAILAELAKA